MKFPNTKQLTKLSDSFNRKKFKKGLKKDLRVIKRQLKKLSKGGVYDYNLSIEEHNYDFWRNWVLFRYLRINTSLNVTVTEDDISYSKKGEKYVGRIYLNIKW